jgi:tetratricopeptide (TPR) repeat protein
MYLYNEEYTNAIRTFNIILSYKPEFSEALFLRGYAKFQLSDYAGAIQDFSKSVESDRFMTDALYYRAIANVELNNYNAALKDLISAIDIDDRHAHYYVARGYLHTEYGDTVGAISDYEKALKINPENVSSHLNLGLIYMHKKEYDRALVYSENATKYDPGNLQAILLKGNIHQYKNEYNKALAEYKKVIAQDSNHTRGNFLAGLCYQELEKFDTAYLYYNKVLKLNPDNAVIYYHRALLDMETERYPEALSDLNKVLDLNPRNIYAYHLRGTVKIYLEDFAGAEEDFSKAIELYPLMIDAYRNRAYARGVQNKVLGYYEDQNAIDSLFKMAGTDVMDVSLDYFKSITDFRTDFTNVADVSESKIQYIEQSIRMISPYHPVIRTNYETPEALHSLKSIIHFQELALELVLINYDYADFTNAQLLQLKEKISKQKKAYPDSTKYILLSSLLDGWQMEYSDANTQLENKSIQKELQGLSSFIKANHSFFIGSIMASFEIKHFRLDKSNQINFSTSENEVVNEKYEEAIAFYNESIDLDPEFIYSYYNRGVRSCNTKKLWRRTG